MKPYETIQELLEDSKIHGPYIVENGGNVYSSITSIHKVTPTCIRVVLDGMHNVPIHVKDLVQYYTWQDGSPCGKSIEV
jgi:hypothetical protein